MILVPNKKLYDVAIVGLPSSGKTSIAERLEGVGYEHISNDKVRDDIFNGKRVFDLEDHEWYILFSEVNLRKHLRFLEGKNVVSDNCSYSEGLRRTTLHTSLELQKYFVKTRQELVRYLIDLKVDRDELIRRNRERGRAGEESDQYNNWLYENWETPRDFEDNFGLVKAFSYENNNLDDQKRIFENLSNLLDVDLIQQSQT